MTENTKIAEEPSKTIGMSPSTDVQITDSRGCVDNDPVQVHKGGQVTWFAYGNEKATIVFPAGSPFDDDVVGVPASGLAKRTVRKDAESRHYKYTVVAPGGSNDPEVIIR